MLFFAVFFYLLSTIFKTFKAPKLFTDRAIKQLNYFALLNLIAAPLLFLTIDFFIMQKQQIGNILNYLLTFLLGIFLLFIVAIFKQGYQVQNENDLTI
jgi:predicted membrane channel-forming protein YqfA (hemolysin III family)